MIRVGLTKNSLWLNKNLQTLPYMKNLSTSLKLYLDSQIKAKHQNSFLKFLFSALSYRLRLLNHSLVTKKSVGINEIKTDVLFIHSVDLMKKLDRKRNIIKALIDKGLSVNEINPQHSRDIKKSQEIYGTTTESILFRSYDLHAQFIIRKYKPKIIITDRNGDLLSPFLKKHIKPNGIVIHTPHSVLTAESHKYSMIDYDYYLLYGMSSLEYLKKLDNKYGECKAVLAGSYLFDKDFSLPPGNTEKSILLLGMGPAMEEDPVYFKYYIAIKKWAKKNPGIDLEVRLHPRSENTFWAEAAKDLKNVTIRPKGESFKDSCKNSFMCLTSYTNAVVDAALLNRPSLLICGSEIEDYLQTERFFPKRVSETEKLNDSIEYYKTNYEEILKQTEKFAKFHVEQKSNSVSFITDFIKNAEKDLIESQYETIIGEFQA